MNRRHIGQRLLRREDAALLRGAGRTVADLDLPGVVEVAFARSQVAHGMLRQVDVTAARTVDGVMGAWAAADLPDLPLVPDAPKDGYHWPPLARDRVRYAGEALAVVAGVRRAHAEDGVERVRVEIDPLPGLPEAAMAAGGGAAALFPPNSNVVAVNDAGAVDDAVWGEAAHVIEGRFREQRVIPSPIEARAVAARPEPGGGFTVWCSHQAQHRLRAALARAFGLAEDAVRVVVPQVGGAFGSKSQTYPEYLVVCRLARELGRPVRWVEDRLEALTAATRGRGQDQRVRLAADAEGRFLAYELIVDADVGAYPHTGALIPMLTVAMSTGAYRTPQVHASSRAVVTTTAPTSAYRGAGRPEAAFAIERSVDLMARRMGVDPAELRRQNFITSFPYETPTGRTYDSGDYAAAMEKGLAEVGYDHWRQEQSARRAKGGTPIGIGMATYVERSGGSPDSDEYGSVEVCGDGTFLARSGSTGTGQGHLTAFAQVVASVLDVDVSQVAVLEGDTREVPYGFGTFGSRSMQVGGEALAQAAGGLIDEARKRAGSRWSVAPGEVEWSSGQLVGPDGARIAVGDLVAGGEPLRVEVRAAPPLAFPFGAYIAVVEVDPSLGTVSILRFVAVDDYGVVVNPLIVDGQGEGSMAQGLGQALWEEATVDPDGVPTALTLLDYLLPVAGDLPAVQFEETETPNPNTWVGGKGAGESGCIGAPPAIVNAVCDALDVDHLDMPLTPEKVWRAARHDR
ncbi:MAG: xanthine dehydrogenase family protein molybdopterin-binding subunit [Acidimicrobiales bacterium]